MKAVTCSIINLQPQATKHHYLPYRLTFLADILQNAVPKINRNTTYTQERTHRISKLTDS